MAISLVPERLGCASRQITFRLGMYVFKEDDIYIVYCPALDLSACGITAEDAQKEFETVLDETFNYELSKHTFVIDLCKHGWHVEHRGGEPCSVDAPSFNEMLENETFRDILRNKEYSKYDREVGIPI